MTPEERSALTLELIKRDDSFADVCSHYPISRTITYKIGGAFLEGGRRSLSGVGVRAGVDRVVDEARSGAVIG